MGAESFLFPIAVVVLAYVVLGLTGFGSALIAVPLLAWRWPLTDVVPLVLLLDAPTTLMLGGLNFAQVARGELRRLLPGMVAGALVGLVLAAWLAPRWPLTALGLYVVVAGVRALRAPPSAPLAPWRDGATHVAGAAIGVIEMMFGTSGPAVLMWLQRRLHDVHALRATAPVVMVIATIAVLAGMGLAGRLSSAELWQRWAVLVGVALAGVLLGNRLARHVRVAALRRVICGLLVASGVALVWRAWQP